MTQRPGYILKPLPIAAEIHGLSIAQIQHAETRASLYADWMEHGVLVFRDIPVTNAEHLELSRVFGDLELHPLPEIRNAEEPLLMDLGGKKATRAFVYDGDKLRVDRIAWHRDTAYTVEIAKGAMLRVVERPAEGGHTDFCDTAKAYDALSADLRALIDGLEFKATLVLDQLLMRLGTTWQSLRPATEEECPGSKHNVPLEALKRYPSVVHPLVIAHPESGRRCIYVSPTYLDEILGLEGAESDDLLKTIVEHTISPRFCYRHHWRENDLVLWDNRRMMHAATGYDPKYRRRGLRTTLAGSLKSGRMYDPTAEQVKAALVD
jgi:taurine dioxygenase